jgi:hypothetical protein
MRYITQIVETELDTMINIVDLSHPEQPHIIDYVSYNQYGENAMYIAQIKIGELHTKN